MTKPDGGQAFPTVHPSGMYDYRLQGMTLRQWYAGQALPAFITSSNAPAFTAECACEYADALIKELNNKGE